MLRCCQGVLGSPTGEIVTQKARRSSYARLLPKGRKKSQKLLCAAKGCHADFFSPAEMAEMAEMALRRKG